MTELDSRRRRLLFRANHRGTKEADLMIGAFVARHIATLSEPELEALEAALEHWDVDLADWLSRRRPVPPEHASPMLDRLIQECAELGAGLPAHLRPSDDGGPGEASDDRGADQPEGLNRPTDQ